ncbi:MAG TPA: metallophosphoesterase [Pyrinomonadaceae bacterium]|nr:metallophosphoesterase [Pyrinomonadaceae bacterium]
MWNANELIVLSDIHLAADSDTGSFQADRDLADCLRWILTETRDSVIVIAGDFLDLVDATNCISGCVSGRYTCYTKQIVDHHPEVFDAVKSLAQSSRHHLVILGGEHDSELLFPDVRETLERRLGIGLFQPAVRWLVQQEALRMQVGNAVVIVEHGNVLDPWNRIDYNSLHLDLSLHSRNLIAPNAHQPPLGRRLITKVINALHSDYKWTKWLKPANELVLPLLWSVSGGRQKKELRQLAEDYLSIKTFALNKNHSSDPTTLYYGEKETEQVSKDRAFEEWIDAIYSPPQEKDNLSPLYGKLLETTRLISGRDTFLDVEQPDSSVKYLKPVFDSGADVVIHGHTHAAKALSVGKGIYMNTGTWSQILPVPKSFESDGVWMQFLEHLRTNELNSFLRPTFAYVQHQPDKATTTATLFEWRESQPIILAKHGCGK